MLAVLRAQEQHQQQDTTLNSGSLTSIPDVLQVTLQMMQQVECLPESRPTTANSFNTTVDISRPPTANSSCSSKCSCASRVTNIRVSCSDDTSCSSEKSCSLISGALSLRPAVPDGGNAGGAFSRYSPASVNSNPNTYCMKSRNPQQTDSDHCGKRSARTRRTNRTGAQLQSTGVVVASRNVQEFTPTALNNTLNAIQETGTALHHAAAAAVHSHFNDGKLTVVTAVDQDIIANHAALRQLYDPSAELTLCNDAFMDTDSSISTNSVSSV